MAGSVAPKPVKRPATVGGAVPPKKTQQKKQLGCAPAGKGKAPAKVAERNLGQEEVDEKASAIFSEEIISGLSDGNWKTRLSAVEQLTQVMLIFACKMCWWNEKCRPYFRKPEGIRCMGYIGKCGRIIL